MAQEHESGRFPATAWSRIEAAKDPRHPRFQEAIAWLVSSYQRPVFSFLRAHRHRPEQAEELTQEFLTTFLIKNWVKPANPKRGRFRNFLLTILKRFVSDATTRPTKQKQFESGAMPFSSVEAAGGPMYEPAAPETPDEAFHKEWKAETLRRVRANLKRYYEGLGKPAESLRYQIFVARHLVDRTEDQPAQETLASQFGVTREQVRYALDEVEKRYERFVRQELREETDSEEEVEEEIRELLS
jgi:RNA polymerase sigma-70 factor (ECF subfamily)